jgi:hypothetical protein
VKRVWAILLFFTQIGFIVFTYLCGVEFYDRVENCLFFEVVRPVKNNATHVLAQSWGFGSVEFPLSLV